MKQNRLLSGVLDRLVDLLDESDEIFHAERPWLENPDLPLTADGKRPFIVPDKRREQNELEIARTLDVLKNELKKDREIKTMEGEQSKIQVLT